jgi:hypothetical protein
MKYPYVTNEEPNDRKNNSKISKSKDALDRDLI